MKRILFIFLSLLPYLAVSADTYFVGFRDKAGTTGSISNPADYLSERAITRRQKQHLSIDSLDLPVSAVYLDSLKKMGVKIIHTSKWINGATIIVPDSISISALRSLQFVDTVQCTKRNLTIPIAARRHKFPLITDSTTIPENAYTYTAQYTSMLRLDSIHDKGFTGQGMRIAVLDNGFQQVNSLSVYEQMRSNIVATFNIVNSNNNVYNSGKHGAMVLSLLAGMKGDTIVGTAPDAEYCLFHTEDDNSESILEIDNMVRAMEMADSLGADIITASLGYFEFDDLRSNYTYADMDGHTTRCSMAASIAAQKGILVCIAAGNEATSTWHYIDAPADAKGILAVGGVDINRQHSTFSSFGPAADGRVKPEVCALATKVPIVYPNDFVNSSGTSFATPIMAGAVASLWSALPDLTAMQIRERIIKYASQYDNPDDTLGYGIPDLLSAYYDIPLSTSVIQLTDHNTAEPINTMIYDISGKSLGNDTHSLPHGVYIMINDGKAKKIIK